MKFISLAVLALIGTSEAVNLRTKDMELDESVPSQDNTQVEATGGDAGQTIEEQAAAAGIDPATLAQAQAEAEAQAGVSAGAGAATVAASTAGAGAAASSDPQYLAEQKLDGGITVNVLE